MQLLYLHILLLTSISGFWHKYYVSITDIELNSQTQTVQVSTRIFTDDLEQTLSNISGRKIILENANDTENNKLLAQYFQKRILISERDSSLELQFLGYEYNIESVWCYLETKTLGKLPQEINVSYTALFESFPEQQNVVNFIYKKEISSRIFNLSNYNYTINFNN